MAKFNENELTEKLKEYENKGNIRLKLERGLDGKIELEDATVIYDEKTGFIKISGYRQASSDSCADGACRKAFGW